MLSPQIGSEQFTSQVALWTPPSSQDSPALVFSTLSPQVGDEQSASHVAVWTPPSSQASPDAVFSTLKDAAERLIAYDRSFEPATAERGYYDDKFSRYVELYQDLKAFNHRYG